MGTRAERSSISNVLSHVAKRHCDVTTAPLNNTCTPRSSIVENKRNNNNNNINKVIERARRYSGSDYHLHYSYVK